jgi:hypothetical protein
MFRRKIARYEKSIKGEPEEKRPLGKPRRTWEDNIKMNIK